MNSTGPGSCSQSAWAACCQLLHPGQLSQTLLVCSIPCRLPAGPVRPDLGGQRWPSHPQNAQKPTGSGLVVHRRQPGMHALLMSPAPSDGPHAAIGSGPDCEQGRQRDAGLPALRQRWLRVGNRPAAIAPEASWSCTLRCTAAGRELELYEAACSLPEGGLTCSAQGTSSSCTPAQPAASSAWCRGGQFPGPASQPAGRLSAGSSAAQEVPRLRG